MKKYAFPLLLAASMLAFTHPTAFHNYASFKGSKQGLLKAVKNGNGGREKDGWWEVFSFDMGTETPTDAAQSVDKGKRKHQPIVIVREVDEASPLLWNALCSKEVFESVAIQTLDDQQHVTKTITLTNALLTDVHKNGTTETLTLTYDHLLIK